MYVYVKYLKYVEYVKCYRINEEQTSDQMDTRVLFMIYTKAWGS